MSHNQSRAERSESTQYRKTGRSVNTTNQQRHFQGGSSTKGGGGAPTNPASRSYKKHNSNAQGTYSRVRSPNVESDSGAHAVHNGPDEQQPTHRASDAPVTSTPATIKPAGGPTQKINQAAPRAPSSNVPSAAPTSNVPVANPESGVPTTPAKGSGDSSFPLQFGSISPGFMNGVQVPARISSAPPNLDEQKKAQARQGLLRAAPAMPIPLPKQQVAKKDAEATDLVSKSKRDAQISASPPVIQSQKPSLHPIPRMPIQMPFHQPQVPVQFGGPNPQIQSQGTSLPLTMQMPLPLGNPQMQQPMFISSLQPHPMQSQGMIHQGHNFHFPSHMGHQLPPMGNMGMNMAPHPQFPQQQAGKYSGSRKTVKITHPDTHEELRLDGWPGPRSHHIVPPQSQPIPSFPPNHQMNYFPNSYNSNSYIPAASSVPMNSTQVPPSSQQPRFYNQVTVKPPVGYHGEKEPSSTSSISVKKAESLEPSRSKPGLGASSTSGSSNIESSAQNNSASVSALVDGSPSTSTSSAAESRKSVVVLDSIKDKCNEPGNIGRQDEVGLQSASQSSLPSQSSEAEAVNTKSTPRINSVPETAGQSISTSVTAPEASKISSEVIAEGKAGDASVSFGVEGFDSRNAELETIGAKEDDTNIDKDSLEKSVRVLSLESSEITGKVVENAGGLLECTEENQGESVGDYVAASSHSGGDKHSDSSVSVNGLSTEDNKISKSDTSLSVPDNTDTVESTTTKSVRVLSLESSEITGKVVENAGGLLECTEENQGESVGDYVAASSRSGGDKHSDSSVSVNGLSTEDNKISKSDTSLSVPDNTDTVESTTTKSLAPQDDDLKPENVATDNNNGGLASTSSSVKDNKVISDINMAKSAVPRVKKKKKDLLRKAEAAGTSSDLYNAYKGPEEKKETIAYAEILEETSSIGAEQKSAEMYQENGISNEKPPQSKVEPDDWEDAAEISPQLHTPKNDQDNENESMTKKYSRDFLLKFAEQCDDLPDGFEITSDIADALMVSSSNISRNIDRPVGGSRPDRRASGYGDEDKWNKMHGVHMSGVRGDMRADVGYVGNMVGFRPGQGQGGNYGVLRNPRAQTPVQYGGGILPGLMQPLGPQGGVLQRNNSDSDRWQRGTGFQKGLMPSPHTPLPVMHKAEKKYEIGNVADEEQAKQRQLKGILNKLTPQNFEKLFQQVKQVNIDNGVTLSGVISQIFDKALTEPTFCEMYADFCFHLATDLPELIVENEKITFKRLLLNKCQEEFERGEREEEEANKADEEGEAKLTGEEREEKRLQARRRMLGNIRLIGELYKKRMLTERIMHECINKLLGQYQNPDEENIEALCKLMSTIGEMIDHPKAKDHMDAYFDIMTQMSNNMKLSSRVRFMLKDAIDLRKNKWQQRRKVEGPKKIDEVHRDAAQERQLQSSRLARAPSMSGSIRRGPHMDFGPRAPSMMSPPGSQMGGFRTGPPQLRGHGSQDVRDERHSYALPQRPLADESITLGPHGGLVRGMAFRGQAPTPGIRLAEMPSPGDARRMGPGLNGFSSIPERAGYGQREDLMPRFVPDRFIAPSNYDQVDPQERNVAYGNREFRNTDRGFDRSLPPSPPARGGHPTSNNASSEKVWPEEQLRDKSLAAIKEFYSARDEIEVALCIKDLNTPSFYPSMISIWLTDSYERKDNERDLLTKLLLNLSKPRDGLISQDQLFKGCESVLTVLEDAVNDAPRAAEFLGHIFARLVLEKVVSLSELGQLIYEGGEEQGSLVEAGIAAELVGSILETIKSEKGDSVLNEIRSSSNLQLQKFRPPGANRSLRIDKFM